jgi:hypothetical protein
MIAEILNDPSMYKALLGLRGRKAEIILDVMQKVYLPNLDVVYILTN